MSGTKLPLLNWLNITEWREVVVGAAIQKSAPRRDRTWLLSRKPDTRYWDTHEWYEPLRVEVGIEENEHLLREFGRELPFLFGKVRGVHLCRPTDFRPYRTRGIVRLNPVEMQEDLIAFLKSEHPELRKLSQRPFQVACSRRHWVRTARSSEGRN